MKKTLALLLCLAMLFTVLTVNVFADGAAITIDDATVDANGDANVAITFSGFDSLKGIDVVFEAEDGIVFNSIASATNLKTDAEVNANYTINEDKTELHIVELVTNETANVLVTVNVSLTGTEAKKISVKSSKLAESGTKLVENYDATDIGTVSPAPAEPTPEEVGTATPEAPATVVQPATAGKFIPFGSVYKQNDDNTYTYASKDESGNFSVTENDYYKMVFDIPEGGFGTFGVSDLVDDKSMTNAIQFGNYANKYNKANKYGTLVVVGDWAGFSTYYKTNKSWDDATLFEKIYDTYNTNNPNGEYSFVKITAGYISVKVYNVKQTNWMWKTATAEGAETDVIEYAVRLTNAAEGTYYTTIPYCVADSGVGFASKAKTSVAINSVKTSA